MTASQGPLEMAAQLAESAREKADADLDDAVCWLRSTWDNAGDTQPAWVFEDAFRATAAALIARGQLSDAQSLESLYHEREHAQVARLHEAGDAELDDLGELIGILADGALVDHPVKAWSDEAEAATFDHSIMIRPPTREEVPSFLQCMRLFVEAEGEVKSSGSFDAYASLYNADQTEACYLMAIGAHGIVGGSIIVSADNAYTELAPAVIAPAYRRMNLGNLITVLHCVQQSFLEPNKGRVYWSAVPTTDAESAHLLRQCGFSTRGSLWPVVADRFEERNIAVNAAWLAASPRAIASRFLANVQALDLEAGASWGDLVAEVGDELKVEVELGGYAAKIGDVVPIAEEVRSWN